MDNRQLGDALQKAYRGRAEGISEEARGDAAEPGARPGGAPKASSEGFSQGVAKRNAEWRAWLERKDAAEAQGLAFDEPPPDERE